MASPHSAVSLNPCSKLVGQTFPIECPARSPILSGAPVRAVSCRTRNSLVVLRGHVRSRGIRYTNILSRSESVLLPNVRVILSPYPYPRFPSFRAEADSLLWLRWIVRAGHVTGRVSRKYYKDITWHGVNSMPHLPRSPGIMHPLSPRSSATSHLLLVRFHPSPQLHCCHTSNKSPSNPFPCHTSHLKVLCLPHFRENRGRGASTCSFARHSASS
jgi:hypothetical protein